MKTRLRFLSIIFLSMLVGSLSAQQGQGQRQRVQRTPEQTAKSQVEWMKTDLKLDEATQQKVYDIVLKYARQSAEERQKAAGDREAIRAKMTEVITARDKELKVVLGDKNFELFKTKETERRQAMMKQRQN